MTQNGISAVLSVVFFLLVGSLLSVITVFPVGVSAATLYVGGTGAGNYTTIQAAVDAANPGDIVYVYNGHYPENVLIDKALSLIGQDKVTAVIDNGSIYISAEWVNVTGFHLAGAGGSYGISLLRSQNCFVADNVISNYTYGIGVSDSGGNSISRNMVSNSMEGIALSQTIGDIVSDNAVTGNQQGIFLGTGAGNSTVIHNTVTDNAYGITLWRTNGGTVEGNTVAWNSQGGIFLGSSWDVGVYHNNIINNSPQAFDDFTNSWDNGYPSGGNYWSDYGGIDIYSGPNQNLPGGDGLGDTPYNISGGNSKDTYPLIEPIGFSLQLEPGRRLVSFPVKVVNGSVQEVLSSISGCYDYVRWYATLDPVSPWKSYVPGRNANSLLKLDSTMGFWINMTSACSLVLGGTRPSSTIISLHHGWNMVGFPSFNTTYTVADLKADVGLSGMIVESFDANAAPYLLQRVIDGYVMKAGEGYWIFAPSDTSWIVNG